MPYELEVLGSRLRVCSVPAEALPAYAYALLQLCFFPNEINAPTAAISITDRLFCITRTKEEISIVLPVEWLSVLEQVGQEQFRFYDSGIIWRVFQVTPGEMGQQESMAQVVHRMTLPLARHGISIMQLSTFSADLTMVPENRLAEALDVLKSDFNILSQFDANDVSVSPQLRPRVRPPVDDEVIPQPLRHPFSIPFECPLKIHSTDIEHTSLILNRLIPELLYRSNGFFSLTWLDDRITFISQEDPNQEITASIFNPRSTASSSRNSSFYYSAENMRWPDFVDSLSAIPVDDDNHDQAPDTQFNHQTQQQQQLNDWQALVIGDIHTATSSSNPSNDHSNTGLGFEEAGIVSSFTQPLAQNGLSCFYLSTFRRDVLLIPRQEFGRAVQLLQECGAVLIEPRAVQESSVDEVDANDVEMKRDDENDDEEGEPPEECQK